jgi:vancomycin resistance protein YoaR
MLGQAEHQRERGGLLDQLQRNLDAKLGRENLAWIVRFDREVAKTTLEKAAKGIEQTAVDAKVDLFTRTWIEEKPGTRLDVEGTLNWLATHHDVDLDFVPLVVERVLPKATLAQLSPVDLRSVLSAFETDFRTRAGPRATNIHVAAKSLNGKVLLPGAVFSFNEVVGPRIESRGFREAPVIVDDELEPGVGGGVCQVATTVHAAAVLAGLQIVERRSHSRPSGYAPMGLDATVIDGKVDLRFRNPYPVALLISATFPDRFRLRVELVGMQPRATLEHRYQVRKRYDFYRRVVTKSDLAHGEVKHRQKGIFGYDVVSTISARDAKDRNLAQQYGSKYWPVPEVYWVGPDTDLSSLPPLPEGATGVQRDGVTVLGHIPKEVEQRASESSAIDESSGN